MTPKDLLYCALSSLILFSDTHHAFLHSPTLITTTKNLSSTHGSTSALFGALNKRNKQGDLMRKMQEAKRQREMAEIGSDDDDYAKGTNVKTIKKSDAEIKKENDMKRFEQLLNSESATINYGIDGNSMNYMTKKQEEEEMDAGCEFFFVLPL